MEPTYILPSAGENQPEYYIQKAFVMDGHCYFIILNMDSFDVMFGEYLGKYDNDMEETRKKIYQEFLDHKPNVTFVDGYILDDLYEMWDNETL